jgi:hypothetical protein
MKIFRHIFVLATVLATFSKKIWANFSASSGPPAPDQPVNPSQEKQISLSL